MKVVLLVSVLLLVDASQGNDRHCQDSSQQLQRTVMRAVRTECIKGHRGMPGTQGPDGTEGHRGFPGPEGEIPFGSQSLRVNSGKGERGDPGRGGPPGPQGVLAHPHTNAVHFWHADNQQHLLQIGDEAHTGDLAMVNETDESFWMRTKLTWIRLLVAEGGRKEVSVGDQKMITDQPDVTMDTEWTDES
ncbi:hypothetical protein CAPTEDRAFT_202743 [Capitella teleta]|uniref:Uncharacterized protein n=1 Tax=Capitella teleta TaxID=283909 RepID=R7T519_CAPTE|nr:hypothetical protein CAPTEDRAFT_202743 [Capitella teleta]|eukprot:ELT88108.1 hypothetical protein CAPTEDRAFT_202743 [Capitella teleta]